MLGFWPISNPSFWASSIEALVIELKEESNISLVTGNVLELSVYQV